MKRDISAGILAGGKSMRMGKNKTCLMLEGETFLEHALRILEAYKDLRVSVDSAAHYPQLTCAVTEDERKGFGPVEGIFQLLCHAKYEYCLIIAADMPLVTTEFLDAFVAALDGSEECLILRAGDRIHPLCGIYKKTVLPLLAEMRRQNIHRIRWLFEQVRTVYVDAETLGFSARVADNINTPEEYERLKKEGFR